MWLTSWAVPPTDTDDRSIRSVRAPTEVAARSKRASAVAGAISAIVSVTLSSVRHDTDSVRAGSSEKVSITRSGQGEASCHGGVCACPGCADAAIGAHAIITAANQMRILVPLMFSRP